MLPPLSSWENFYVIIGSSAAALTGLQFVVIALGAERRVGGQEALDAFATPTVVHFCAVLLISAILSTPGQTALSLGWCLALTGLAGLGYATVIVSRARRQKGYAPVLEDWIFHTILPFVAYFCIFIGGLVVARHPAPGLYAIGATALVLLFVGIHNAWDAAVWMTTVGKNEPRTPPADEDVS